MDNHLEEIGINQEYQMLCNFYDRWKDLHLTARTETNRPILELMAQNLVDAGKAIEVYRKEKGKVTLNG